MRVSYTYIKKYMYVFLYSYPRDTSRYIHVRVYSICIDVYTTRNTKNFHLITSRITYGAPKLVQVQMYNRHRASILQYLRCFGPYTYGTMYYPDFRVLINTDSATNYRTFSRVYAAKRHRHPAESHRRARCTLALKLI